MGGGLRLPLRSVKFLEHLSGDGMRNWQEHSGLGLVDLTVALLRMAVIFAETLCIVLPLMKGLSQYEVMDDLLYR